MKKVYLILLLLISISLLTGCKKDTVVQKIEEEQKQENKVVEKLDKDLDYIYLEDYIVIGEYVLQLPKVNLNTTDASSVNLELKTFISSSYANFDIYDNVLNSGNIIENIIYEYDKYVSLDVKYYYMVDTMMGDYSDIVYVFNTETGKLLSNEDILSIFDLTEDELFSYIEENIDSEDSDYIISNIKSDGYNLFIDNDNSLRIIYYERNDYETKRKELVVG